jgi:hypothetical protein
MTEAGAALTIFLMLCYGIYRLGRWFVKGDIPKDVLDWLINPLWFFFAIMGFIWSLVSILCELSGFSFSDEPLKTNVILFAISSLVLILLFSIRIFLGKHRVKTGRTDWFSGKWWQFWKLP